MGHLDDAPVHQDGIGELQVLQWHVEDSTLRGFGLREGIQCFYFASESVKQMPTYRVQFFAFRGVLVVFYIVDIAQLVDQDRVQHILAVLE